VKALLAVWRILDKRQRHRLVALHILSVLMAFSTIGGMAAILPFFLNCRNPIRCAALHFCARCTDTCI
jgi:hypothetical protein